MSDAAPNHETRIALFQRKEVRRTIHNNEWWFVIVDVVAPLTDSTDPQGYLKDMRRRDPEIAKGWGQIATPLAIATAGGRQNLNCANTEGLSRLIQSIPSPKAEPFKRWLAKVGYERIQEIEDPELATKRIRALYKATFGMTPSQYAEFKRLQRENLRDHMTDPELIFSMLGEAATTEIARNRDAQGFSQNEHAANTGGTVAGNARRELEQRSGRKVVTRQNYLSLAQSARKVGQFTHTKRHKKRRPPRASS